MQNNQRLRGCPSTSNSRPFPHTRKQREFEQYFDFVIEALKTPYDSILVNADQSMTELESQAHEILTFLVQRPFNDCTPISRDFANSTTKPGIYAIRHNQEGLLYIGKAHDIKERFRDGHKAITWSWLEDYNHREVVIATYEIDFRQWQALSSNLESIILIWSKPPFNIRIPMRDKP